MSRDIKILLTGGTGFIGSYILRYLLKQGYENINAIDRTSSDKSLLGSDAEKVQWWTGDILDVPFLETCSKGMDLIIHAAALISFDPKMKDELTEVNVEGTANLVNVALSNDVKKFIFISSISTLDRSTRKAIDEKSDWKDSKHNSNYAISKYLSEMEVWRGGVEGLKICILNPGIVLGAGFWGNGSTQLFDYIWKGGRFYSKGASGFVDVRDIAYITHKAIKNEVENERFILVSENVSYADLFQEISKGLNKKSPASIVPKWVGEITWRVFKIWGFLSRKNPLNNERNL